MTGSLKFHIRESRRHQQLTLEDTVQSCPMPGAVGMEGGWQGGASVEGVVSPGGKG
jgi:hypothetical protein